jgi:hypothetical protein
MGPGIVGVIKAEKALSTENGSVNGSAMYEPHLVRVEQGRQYRSETRVQSSGDDFGVRVRQRDWAIIGELGPGILFVQQPDI